MSTYYYNCSYVQNIRALLEHGMKLNKEQINERYFCLNTASGSLKSPFWKKVNKHFNIQSNVILKHLEDNKNFIANSNTFPA